MTRRDLLAAARSGDWQQRRAAAEALAAYDDAEARAALLGLLCDRDDTAPIQAAADALVARREAMATTLICKAVATADDDAADHLLYFAAIADAANEYALFDLAVAALESCDEDVRVGAQEIIDYLRGTPGWRHQRQQDTPQRAGAPRRAPVSPLLSRGYRKRPPGGSQRWLVYYI